MPVERTAADIEAELLGPDTGEHEGVIDEFEEDLPDTPDPVAVAAEDKAGRNGWVPKHLYKGDPKKWVDAATFNERGERFNKNLQREVETLRAELASFKGTAKKFAEFHEQTIAKKNEEIKDAISALRVQKAQAIVDGDAQLSVEIEDRIDLLKDQQKEVKEVAKEETAATQAPRTDPVLEEWIEDGNGWWKDEPKMRDYAIELGTKMREAGVPVNGREFLDKVSADMRRDFPRYFRTKAAGNRQSAVDSGDTGSSQGGQSRYSERDLPAEDRKLMREFIAQGVTTKEKFLASYFSDAPRKHA